MNKNAIALGVIVLIILGFGVFAVMQKNNQEQSKNKNSLQQQSEGTKQPDSQNNRVSDEQKLQEQKVPAGSSSVASAVYTITPSSKVEWEGKKTLLANYIDKGVLMVKEGKAVVKDGVITSGEIIFDMNSITAFATGKQQGQDMLSKHLKSDAFFDSEKYPTATFVLKEATKKGEEFQYLLKGDMTIKGITNPVELPARIYTKDGEVRVDAVATLDRTKWDIRFGSGKFFKDLADNVIDDYFTVTFSLNAYQTVEESQTFANPSSTPPSQLPPAFPSEIPTTEKK